MVLPVIGGGMLMGLSGQLLGGGSAIGMNMTFRSVDGLTGAQRITNRAAQRIQVEVDRNLELYQRAFYPAYFNTYRALVLPDLRRATPVRTGRAINSYRVTVRGNTLTLETTAAAFYTPLIDTGGGKRIAELARDLFHQHKHAMAEAGAKAGAAAAASRP